MAKRLNGDDNPDTGVNEVSVFGYGEMSNYPPLNKERAKMSGLNMGRQNDNTVLINALQIFSVDTLILSRFKKLLILGKRNCLILSLICRKRSLNLLRIELDGSAPELYVRETRHMQGEYRLEYRRCLYECRSMGSHWLWLLSRGYSTYLPTDQAMSFVNRNNMQFRSAASCRRK